MNHLSKKEIILISIMLFSMFFGAGNLIFPPFLGQSAGDNLWLSLAGFILSAAGLPILGVIAVARAGGFSALAGRVHPSFAFLFPFLIYLSIGPGLAIPRAGSLAYEMGALPFLSANLKESPIALAVYTLAFFGVVFWLSLSPSKLVDRFSKLLTPLLLVMIAIIFIRSLFMPMNTLQAPKGNYAANPAFQGFLDGYLTMDALAALAFGIVIANTLKAKGVHEEKSLSVYMVYAGLGAGILLSVIYLALGYLGAVAPHAAEAKNGAQILTLLMNHLFGAGGTMLLGLLFTLACLCVSIGLVISCSQFFNTTLPWLSYKGWATVLTVWSMAIANLGLTQILKVSVPVLGILYPVAIILIILALAHRYIATASVVYTITVGLVGLFSLIDIVNTVFLAGKWSSSLSGLPLYSEGLGWIVPAIVGILTGNILDKIKNIRNTHTEKDAA
ncbi:branched-chain amino acid transport system II carrier protein [Aneurinibacillus aneurinilyticus]|jgi:LIVCS family branched-chain amino acid:cation transporter|uniref:Branched-chain amino acid transport system carrier protein n=1 Tax=Aneurinibacillus aneurinilyticus ATCC 12856 TaxID=649747 RepID=U1Y9K6_ANEAE|nr:branched-chain amino acid transport system II carrier protein [Aneurinibacillus aneurinilyticus]ERI07511.1 branched-chain amino acid transport system II carrier protein [Aneurinibacillus aneurinilyticus ATCC 12856]MCI1692833.1 branched-chain amino acid transport system II carrier protein [Aneurinibacillus aneurinilyticus]MED0709204.1 branched-chain amino acid transport system II carrier protein [Aneurinibacillus aneurinilyticus]MED0721994.1 branched-chain amino acid transport system II carri